MAIHEPKKIEPIMAHEIFNQLCDLLGIDARERAFIQGLKVELEQGGFVHLDIQRIASKEL